MQGSAHEAAAGENASLSPTHELLSNDLYELLQVSPRASLGVIQAAYRVLARSYHPDVNNGPETGHIMRRLNAAYDVLSDPRRRAHYDAQFSARPRRSIPRSRARSTHIRGPQPQLAPDRSTGVPVLGRVMVVGVLISMVVGALLLTWVILAELDDRPAPGFRPRAASPEISAPVASSARSTR